MLDQLPPARVNVRYRVEAINLFTHFDPRTIIQVWIPVTAFLHFVCQQVDSEAGRLDRAKVLGMCDELFVGLADDCIHDKMFSGNIWADRHAGGEEYRLAFSAWETPVLALFYHIDPQTSSGIICSMR